MTTNTALIEKREELKRRLVAGEYKTLVDVFLASTDRLIQRITRRSKPLPIWLTTVILSMVFILIAFAAIYVAGELTAFRNYIELNGSDVLALLSSGVLAIASAVLINRCIGRILKLWQDDILDATESVASLEEFEDWLEKTCNPRLHLRVIIIGGLLLDSYLMATISINIGVFAGYGLTFAGIIPSMFGSVFLYLLLMVILLSAKLRRYDLKLFVADPSSSELASRLSGELSLFIYFVGVYAAVLTLLVALSGYLSLTGIFLVLFYWLPIIAIFISNQTGLSSIIRRVKWKTLNEIQAKVENLQSSENFVNKETMEAINRLMDYHERVNRTRNSALDLRTVLSFINSLLLPLLAFLLGNLDTVLALFGKKP